MDKQYRKWVDRLSDDWMYGQMDGMMDSNRSNHKVSFSIGYFIMVYTTDNFSNIGVQAEVALRQCVQVRKPHPIAKGWLISVRQLVFYWQTIKIIGEGVRVIHIPML